ncbi:putative DD41D transposase [Trichonephila clavipes]|nr:putative DD41D transposase [Trichonephila clavipes]
MGININAQNGQNSEYVRAVHELGEIFMHRVVRPWLYPDFIFKWTALGRSNDANIRIVKELTKKKLSFKMYIIVNSNNSGRFVEWAQNEIAVVPDFHKRILFSDEAHFWLNGYVNKQNCRIWSESNPQVYVETPLHPEKLTVWCALWAGGILLQKR